MYSVFGGTVDVTGEILHGKTSPLHHDGKGVYKGLRQQLPVTRYHSLAGTHPTLPECLEVSSWTPTTVENGNTVIMGVRHKEYVIEGVQFHPESILTEDGLLMLRNFLKMQGGTWAENEKLQLRHSMTSNGITNGITNDTTDSKQDKQSSILEKIYAHRKAAVATQKEIPSRRPSDLRAAYTLNLAPPQTSFPDRLPAHRRQRQRHGRNQARVTLEGHNIHLRLRTHTSTNLRSGRCERHLCAHGARMVQG